MGQRNMDNSPLVFLVGLLTGALAVALLTPKNGQEMRHEIKRKLDEKRNSIGEMHLGAKDKSAKVAKDNKKTVTSEKI